MFSTKTVEVARQGSSTIESEPAATWKIIASLITLICTVLILEALCNPINRDAGIITIIFDTDVPLKIPLVSRRQGFPSIQSIAESHIPTIATAVQSGIASAETMVEQKVPFPKNISVGTSELCVGFSNKISCHILPVTLMDLIPSSTTQIAQNEFDLQQLQDILTKVSTPYIKYLLITGLTTLCIRAILIFLPFFERLPSKYRLYLSLGWSMIYCLPLTVSVAILYRLHASAPDLPHSQFGSVDLLSLISLIGAIGFTICLILESRWPSDTRRRSDRERGDEALTADSGRMVLPASAEHYILESQKRSQPHRNHTKRRQSHYENDTSCPEPYSDCRYTSLRHLDPILEDDTVEERS